ncbi:MAG: 50S ribosomal protein L10 [Synergistaceae bacterium]|jgi:large subunit ribosomal protein L10|nr:50S ribosomal protein L10 [Synergistaceae bacterium]
MPTQVKRTKIDALVELLKKSNGVFITEYRGLTVKKINDCRRQITQAGGEMKVCKNTLMRIALTECDFPQASELDFGPNAYVFSYGDVAAVAKSIRDFTKVKGNGALIVKGAILDGQILSKEEVFALADLPSREVLLTQTVRAIASPLQGLVNVLSAPTKGLVTCLAQIKDKKEKETAA